MARIDRFLEAITQRGADRLRLEAGKPAALIFGSESRPITAALLNKKLLDDYTGEIAPAELAEELAQDGAHGFEHVHSGVRYAVSIERRGEAMRVEVTSVAKAASPAPAKSAAAASPAPAPKPAPASAAPERAPDAGNAAPAPSAAATRTAAAPAAVAPPAKAVAPARTESPPATNGGLEAVTPGPETAAMDALFHEMVRERCSDLHLSSKNPPLFRKDGGMTALSSTQPLAPEVVREMLFSITPPARRAEFEERRDSDFSYEISGLGRFRCNLFMDRKGMGGVFRVIPNDILTAEKLGLSQHILQLCHLHKGLVVVTGPTGSGKSTTLAAMIDYINRNRSAHIITIEDPIEFVHDNKKCLINQREIRTHTGGFKPALRAALREDPDIVLVGEMRDLETVEIAIETAETGHLVFGTLHTNTASSTVDRIIDQFPTDRQAQVRTMLASSLKGVIAQTLCKKIGGGRAAALEVLIVNSAISNLIREGKTFQIGSMMQTGKKLGMITLGDALAKLVDAKLVEPQEAYSKAVDRAEFEKLLNSRGIRLELDESEKGQ
jgi:twitching motility protein PilT